MGDGVLGMVGVCVWVLVCLVKDGNRQSGGQVRAMLSLTGRPFYR